MDYIDQIKVNDTTYTIRDPDAQPKETGKGLSTNDFANTYKEQLDNLETTLGNYQSKELGKGLSTNDFTAGYKALLDQIFIARVHETEGAEIEAALAANKLVLAVTGQENVYIFSKAHVISSSYTDYEFVRVEDKTIYYYKVSNTAVNSNWRLSTHKLLLAPGDSTVPASKVAVTSSSNTGLIDFYDIESTLSNHENAFVNSKGIYDALNEKVSKQSGMGLSRHNFTDEYKAKLDALRNITIDQELSGTSTNPVENRAIHGAFQALSGLYQPILSFDPTPTENSSNPVTSDGVYDVVAGLQDQIDYLEAQLESMQGESVVNPVVRNDVAYLFGNQAEVDQNDYLTLSNAQISSDIVVI